MTAIIPTVVSTKQPVKYQYSDYKWIDENKGKHLENGGGQLERAQLLITGKLMRHYVKSEHDKTHWGAEPLHQYLRE